MSGGGSEESELAIVAALDDVASEHLEELYHLGEDWRTTASTFIEPFHTVEFR